MAEDYTDVIEAVLNVLNDCDKSFVARVTIARRMLSNVIGNKLTDSQNEKERLLHRKSDFRDDGS
jgi:hypothetical protein